MQLVQAPSELSDVVMSSILNDDQQALLEPIKQLCKGLSLSQQTQFAAEWARSGAEIDQLLQFAQWGWLSPAVLARGDAAQVISARLSPSQADIVRSLTEGLDLDAKEAQRLAQLQTTLTLDGARRDVGQMLYTRHCANCHQLRGVGTVVGPQLDGAAARSVERLLEDIVTPDRNVDHAFRTTTVLLDDGRSISGLVTSESESQITLADPTGKLITIDAATIEQRREAGRSLMPANLTEVLSQEELRDLIHFVKGG
jgi:putative heme-binding domain-containing protein